MKTSTKEFIRGIIFMLVVLAVAYVFYYWLVWVLIIENIMRLVK